MERIRTNWLENRALLDSGFEVAGENLTHLIDANRNAVDTVNTNSDLLTLEARLTKELFGIAARTVGYGDFARAKRGSGMAQHQNWETPGASRLAKTC